MRAISVKGGRGPASAMFVDDTIPDPVAQEDRVLVQVKAFGLNRMDIMQREATYPVKLPEGAEGNIMGVEFSGVVLELGSGCSPDKFHVGDRVFGLVYGGAYAEKVTISEKMLMHLPSELSDAEGAGTPETFFTAIQAIHLVGSIPPSNANVLIHAGASGVGQSAIQLARLAGANKIFATAGSPEKCELVKSLGADFAINYRTGEEDFADVVARETGGRGVDLIVDLVGADYWERNVRCAAVDARIVIVSMLSGYKIPDFDLRPLLAKRVWVCTTTLRSRQPEYQVKVKEFFVENVLPALVQGKVKTVVDRLYSWHQIKEAHERMEANQNAGKIICTVD